MPDRRTTRPQAPARSVHAAYPVPDRPLGTPRASLLGLPLAVALAAALALLLAPLAAPAPAQDSWGQVPFEDLHGTAPDFAGENAVILFDKGEAWIDWRGDLRVSRHRRTKILTPAGVSECGEVTVPSWERFKLIELQAHTILPTGQKVRVKEFFEEGIEELRVKKFAFPALEPGCVVEYMYKARSKDLPEWFFQNELRTRLSRFDLSYPHLLGASGFFTGLAGRAPELVTSRVNDPENVSQELVRNTWVHRDVPPVQPEPMSPNLRDHRTALRFTLKIGSETWQDIGKRIAKGEEAFLKKGGGADDWVRRKTEGLSDPLEKAKAVHAAVRDEIRDASQRVPGSLEEVLRTGTATPNQRNLVLVDLLRRAGARSQSVYISTRDHGMFLPQYAHAGQLNRILARAEIGGTTYYLDANDRHCPFGVLSPDDVVDRGLVMGADTDEPCALAIPAVESARAVTGTIELAPDGAATCRFSLRYTGLEAVAVRDALASSTEREFATSLVTRRFPGAQVDSLRTSGVAEPEEPVVMELVVRVPDLAQAAPPVLLLSSPHLFRLTASPFPAERRALPIDFVYPHEVTENLEIVLPEGFELSALPREESADGHDLRFRTRAGVGPGSIRLVREVRVRTREIPAKEYAVIRDFYARLVAADRAQLVLKPAS